MSKKKVKDLPEHAQSSAAEGALFKEEIPGKLHLADVWMNEQKLPPKHGRQLEAAGEGTLMGRLAERMASRDMIDELNLGPKGRSGLVKKAQVADFSNEIPSKLFLGAGLHEQTKDKKASNFSNPIPGGKVLPGNNMAEQAKAAGNVFNTMHKKLNTADNGNEDITLKHGKDLDSDFDSKQLKMGIEIEHEHSDDDKIAKQIAKAHLAEIPDYYTRLKKMEEEAKN